MWLFYLVNSFLPLILFSAAAIPVIGFLGLDAVEPIFDNDFHGFIFGTGILPALNQFNDEYSRLAGQRLPRRGHR